eukprot:1102997-Pyramimonas_sp.AAC.2
MISNVENQTFRKSNVSKIEKAFTVRPLRGPTGFFNWYVTFIQEFGSAQYLPEGQLIGGAAERLAEHLVSHADAKDGHLPEDGLRVGHGPGGGGG